MLRITSTTSAFLLCPDMWLIVTVILVQFHCNRGSSAYWSFSCVFIGCCPTPGSYGIRKVFSCKSAIGSDACRAGLINCIPITKLYRCWIPAGCLTCVNPSASVPGGVVCGQNSRREELMFSRAVRYGDISTTKYHFRNNETAMWYHSVENCIAHRNSDTRYVMFAKSVNVMVAIYRHRFKILPGERYIALIPTWSTKILKRGKALQCWYTEIGYAQPAITAYYTFSLCRASEKCEVTLNGLYTVANQAPGSFSRASQSQWIHVRVKETALIVSCLCTWRRKRDIPEEYPGKYPLSPFSDQRHLPARFSHAKIRSDPAGGLNPIENGWNVRRILKSSMCEIRASLISASYARLHNRGSKLDTRSDLRSTQKAVAQFEFRAGLDTEMKFISNRRNWRFKISIRDQQPSRASTVPYISGHGGVVVTLLDSLIRESGSSPGGVAPGLSHVGIVLDDAAGRWVSSGISRFLHPCIPALLNAHLVSLPSALKTWMLRAALATSSRQLAFDLRKVQCSLYREHALGTQESLNASSRTRSLETEQIAQRKSGNWEGMGHDRCKDPPQHSPGVISGIHGNPKSGWPDPDSNPTSSVDRGPASTGYCNREVALKIPAVRSRRRPSVFSPPPPSPLHHKPPPSHTVTVVCVLRPRGQGSPTTCDLPLKTPPTAEWILGRAISGGKEISRKDFKSRADVSELLSGPVEYENAFSSRQQPMAVDKLLLGAYSIEVYHVEGDHDKRKSDKGDIATLIEYDVAANREALNWRAVFQSHFVYLCDFQRLPYLKTYLPDTVKYLPDTVKYDSTAVDYTTTYGAQQPTIHLLMEHSSRLYICLWSTAVDYTTAYGALQSTIQLLMEHCSRLYNCLWSTAVDYTTAYGAQQSTIQLLMEHCSRLYNCLWSTAVDYTTAYGALQSTIQLPMEHCSRLYNCLWSTAVDYTTAYGAQQPTIQR
ncbi:hypothetical protein PR048_029548 [Dryococelus australis]|uniref:Uncharacterized protein n=1 Tax=Dryococelus australis TaxID=614101 RepID=A0ABQ9GDP2_9NEOP|nr:hypothetical protein PR048_029548 [Dryococelus australis]